MECLAEIRDFGTADALCDFLVRSGQKIIFWILNMEELGNPYISSAYVTTESEVETVLGNAHLGGKRSCTSLIHFNATMGMAELTGDLVLGYVICIPKNAPIDVDQHLIDSVKIVSIKNSKK